MALRPWSLERQLCLNGIAVPFVAATKDLEDPQGAMGEPEALHFLGTAGFSERCPEAADLIAGIQLSDADYASLEDMVVNEYGEGREAEAVEAWISENPNAFSTIIVQ